MKHLCLTSIFVFLLSVANAQTYKPFKVDMGISFDMPIENESSFGGGFYLEPRYSSSDYLTFGFRMQWSALSSGSVRINNSAININSTTVQSYLFMSEYFFNAEKVRPFVGFGFGMYKKKLSGVNISGSVIQVGDLEGSATNFGVCPRLGINAGHFRLYTAYNFTGKDISNFLSINLGIEIGGGPMRGHTR